MTIKLTLRVNPLLIQQAKTYAKEKGRSVSQIVADYFTALSPSTKKSSQSSLPITRTLRGVLKKSSISKQAYYDYIEEKFL